MKLYFIFSLLIILILPGCGNKDKSSSGNSRDLKKGSYNVLLITIDTLRYDRLSIYSDKYSKTPNIDKVAKDSFIFTRGFAHNPVTLPSHTNIMTGTTPLYHGISDNSGFVLEKRFLTLAEHLKDNGYETGAFIGAFPLDSRFGLNQGFDLYDDNYGTHSSLELFFVERKAEKVIDPAMNWLSERGKKWFCWVHIFDPHQPYLPPPPYDNQYKDDLYSGEVAYVDAALGKLFNYLRDNGKYDNTLIIITGDHGEALGEKGEKTHAYFAYNNTIHIPFIIKTPSGDGVTIRENVSHIDIFPTVCDLVGVEIPRHIQGNSLKPVMEGKQKGEEYIYFESLGPYLNRGWAPLRGFIHGNDKFIDQPIREFYDLSKDMDEGSNIIGKKNGGNLKYDLSKLIKRLTNSDKIERSGNLDADTKKKLKSLGYFSGTNRNKKEVFSEKDDLKTLLPIQDKMLEALALRQSGNLRGSISKLKEIIKISPGYLLIYSHLAKLYQEMGKTELAVSIIRQGLNNNPGDPSLLAKLGIFLVENRQPGKAIEILEQSIILQKYDPESFNYLGVAYYRNGNFDKALENYSKALELDRNYASVYNNIGSLYLSLYRKTGQNSDFSKAISGFDKALEIDGNLYSAYNGRGAAKYFIGDFIGAVSDWKKSLSAKPDFIDPYFSIGITYMDKLGDKKSAYNYLKLCKEKFYEKLPVREKQRLDRLIAEAGSG